MKKLAFYIDEVDSLYNKISDFENKTKKDIDFSIEDLILETELILCNYAKDYPALIDLERLKEDYSGRLNDIDNQVLKRLYSILEIFKRYIADHR